MSAESVAMSGVENGVVETAQPELEPRARPSRSDPAHDWLCYWCFNRVASEKDRLAPDGQHEFTFKNPEGVWFRLLLFARAVGCREVGAPTLEHTWFPGHAWSYCVCDRCRMHLGWYYAGPSQFVGLIRDRIVRASVVMS